MKRTDKARVSLAGEFAVLSQLALLGKDANMTLGNTKGVDILVSDPITGRMLKLEVKTHCRRIRDTGIKSKIFGRFLSSWIMKEKNGKYNKKKDANLFYCFANIENEEHRFFIVPAKVVADYIRWEFKQFQKMKRKAGKVAKDVGMRQFRIGSKDHKDKFRETPTADKYENNWDFKTND